MKLVVIKPMLSLVLHPRDSRSPRHGVYAAAQRVSANPQELLLTYEVTSELEDNESVIQWDAREVSSQIQPEAHLGSGLDRRRDDLWKSTCLECFFSIYGGNQYIEWNFSPRMDWQAYWFESYRSQRKTIETSAPYIEVLKGVRQKTCQKEVLKKRFEVVIEVPPSMAQSALELSLTAVILEKNDEHPFYWATHHSGAMPDFHLRSSFSILLEA